MKRPLCGPKLISSLFAASLASTAFAGEGGENAPIPQTPAAPAVPSKEETLLPEVVVTGEKGYNPGTSALHRNTQPLRNTPQSITVVPRQLMDDQGVTTMRDVLRNVSGISIAAGEAGAQGDSLTIRGFSARSDFFLDGMRDFGSYYRDPFNVDQIEVLQGPASVMFGRGSTGGAVNQVSKLPLAAPLSEATFAVGSDNTRRATADISRPLETPGAGFRINMMGQTGGVAGRNVAQNARYGFAPAITLGAGTPNRLTLTYLHQNESDVPDYGVPWMFGAPAPGIDRRNFYGFPNDYLKTTADVVTAKGEHDFSEHVTVRDQIRFANYDRDARITEPQVPGTVTPSTPLGAVTVNRNEITTKSTEGTLQNQFDALAKFQTGPVRHDLVLGVETDHETSNPTRTTYTGVPATTLLAPNDGAQFSGTGAVTTAVQATVDSLAFYGIETAHLGEKWDLIGGLRWDHVASYYSQAVTPAASFSRVDELPSWRGAVVFKPRPNGSVYASAGTSFNPSADQIALSAATSGLPPEKSRTYEVGTKWDFADGRLTVDGAVFRDEKVNARETDPNNAALNILSGDQRVDGFSIGIRGAITELWQAFAGYTYLKSKVVSSVTPGVTGRPLGNTPKNTVAAWTTYKLPWDVQVGGGVDVVSARAGGTTPSTGTTAETGYIAQAPGYAVLNAMVKRQMTKKISVQLSVANLADTFYYDGIHPGHVIPGAGRTFTLTTDWKF